MGVAVRSRDVAPTPRCAQVRDVSKSDDAATRDVPVYREWIGTIDGSENADIRARVTGHLIKRNYNEGSLVKKGDVLFEIDPRPFETALAQARSQLDEGKAAALSAATDRYATTSCSPKK